MKKAKLSCAKLAKLLIARVLVCAAIKRYCVDKQLESLARNRERTGHVYPQQKSGLLDFRRELSAGTVRRGNALPESPIAFVQLCWWGKLEQGSAFDAVGV